ncbi:hypothetical protein BD413DRAFT_483263, partial [Trametes elegans]
WTCPYCTFTQSNAGVQDCQRHLDTHAIPGAQVWICCGIPASEAPDPPGTRENFFARPVLEFLPGFWLVGGCNKLFSRRDALERHLRTRKGKCLGDERASYQPGNNLTRTPFRPRP